MSPSGPDSTMLFAGAAVALAVIFGAYGLILGYRHRATAIRLAAVAASASQELEARNRRIALLEQELEEVKDGRTAFIRRCRHDIIGCLNVVSGFRELLAQDTNGPESERQMYMDRMADGLTRAFQAVNRLTASQGSQPREVKGSEAIVRDGGLVA
jgi:signal transduction histidine kinase